MERRENREGYRKHGFNLRRRFMAYAVMMVIAFLYVQGNSSVAWGSQTSIPMEFKIQETDLTAAVQEAVVNGTQVTEEELNVTDMFFQDGRVVEVFPDIQGGDADTQVRVFVRLPEDADETYVPTGDEEMEFLYSNYGQESVNCSTSIVQSVNGEDGVWKTGRVTLKAHEEALGDDEAEVVFKTVTGDIPEAR